MSGSRNGKQMLLFVSSVVLLAVGGAAWLLGLETPAAVLWFGDTVLGLVVSCCGWRPRSAVVSRAWT